jgi:hypothetical protein
MHGSGIDQAIFAVKDKNSGKVYTTMVDGPPGDIDEILRRVMVVEGKARAGLIPEECDRPSYPCPFFRLHPEKDDDRPEALVASGDELDQLLSEYAALRDDESEIRSRKDDVKAQIDALVGKDEVYNGTVWAVKWDRKTRKNVDHDAMRKDGINVDDYTTETYYYAINVGRSK